MSNLPMYFVFNAGSVPVKSECYSVEEVWAIISKGSGLYSVVSPSGHDVSQFTPF